MIRVLGIETSCDETAASVVALDGASAPDILSNVVLSQIAEHAAFGGVVPEIAARAHVEALDGIVAAALADSGVKLDEIDAIAATAGPGLVGGLIVGLMTAKAIAAAADKPLLAINHLEGHALTARLTDGLAFPYLLLLVSGGHTQIVRVAGVGDYQRWATTIDDALGEAFDKTAKMLACPIPAVRCRKGGREGRPDAFRLSKADEGRRPARLFVLRAQDRGAPGRTGDRAADRPGCRRHLRLFQTAVADALADRVSRALGRFRTEFPDQHEPALVVAGGVAANRVIKATLERLCTTAGFRFVAPPLKLCTDNAAMIAWAGIERLRAGLDEENAFDFVPRSRWPLDTVSVPVVGSGRRGAKA